MNNLRNRVYLIGNLGMDPEVKTFDGGKILAKMSLATNQVYKDADGKKIKDTQWHNLVAWGATAKRVEKMLKKGNEIAVEGKLTYNNFEDKDGKKKYFTEVTVDEFLILGSRGTEKED